MNAWLQKHPRFHLQLHSDQLVVVQPRRMLVSELTNEAIRRGVFHSVPDLIAAIETYLTTYNEDITPFTWTTSVDNILEKIAHARAALPQTHT